jgi:RNA polymerase sigma-70 factor (ECF subfamily)
MPEARAVAEAIFREESGRILATLIRLSGSFDRAEEAMQDAFTAALAAWETAGIPDNPGAWITAAAHRVLIDAARRRSTQRNKSAALRYETETTVAPPDLPHESDMAYPDDRLRLIFTCCHPALAAETQVALTLRTLGGLSTGEIARAFVISEPTLAQRLVRAKRKIETARIPYEVPSTESWPERLATVQTVLYLIFNEGYSATTGVELVRHDLCAEAIRLARLLCKLLPQDAECSGLLALMLLQDSRRLARTSTEGDLITLEEQDRSLWDRAEICEGLALIEEALGKRTPGPYQLQAAIAALHAQAGVPADTDWRQIAALYEELYRLAPTSIVRLNHAAAAAMGFGLERGLAMMDDLAARRELDGYYLFHAARADLLRRLGRRDEARGAYLRALDLTANQIERRYLLSRLTRL